MSVIFSVHTIATLLAASVVISQPVTHFDTDKKLVALTFDACSTIPPAPFDEGVLNYLVENKIPATFFLSGMFIKHNREKIKELSSLDFIELESHGYRHLHYQGKDRKIVEENVLKNGTLIQKLTGRKPVFFRFPFGEYDDSSLEEVERLGYAVVHWTFESGDPDERVMKEDLVKRVLRKTKPGSILIFHINGRGWHTKEAIADIVSQLKAKGYQFVLLKDAIPPTWKGPSPQASKP